MLYPFRYVAYSESRAQFAMHQDPNRLEFVRLVLDKAEVVR